MGPAIDGNTRNISVEIKQVFGEHAAKMTPDFIFIVVELQRQHPESGFANLLKMRCAYRSVRTVDHLNDAGLVRRLDELIATSDIADAKVMGFIK